MPWEKYASVYSAPPPLWKQRGFLDGPSARARDSVRVVFAAEKVRPDYPAPVPDVDESETQTFGLLSLDALV